MTFLFTDIEGSTRLWEREPASMSAALEQHDELVRREVDERGGHVFKTVGDACCAVFGVPSDAVAAAIAAQRRLRAPLAGLELRVRMAIHTGAAELREDDYFGPAVNRVARLLSAGHGGQVLVSGSAVEGFDFGSLPEGALLRDLGEHLLKDLMRPMRIFQVLVPDLAADFPPLRTLDPRRSNLPAQLTSFVGRERQIEQVTGLMAEHRLVTLTGAGGTGKTRLALQIAAGLADSYPDGTWLVDLAPVADPDLVPQAVAAVLGLPDHGRTTVTEALVDHLHARRVLLLLDNCEHLVEPCALLVDRLLRRCETVRVLATSREMLGVPGESVVTVPPLTVPVEPGAGPDDLGRFEATRLFVDRARSVQPALSVTDATAPVVAEICTRLDGIPLAVELAAARMTTLGPAELLERLEDRFRLLSRGSRTALPRHQTLQAMVDWSWGLLDQTERLLLMRLTVFSGGWMLEAAERVCGGDGVSSDDVVDLQDRLVRKSLVVVESDGGSGTRFRLLETIRQYAGERLRETGSLAAMRDRHLAYHRAVAGAAKVELHRPDQKRWLQRLSRDHDNVRAALDWAVETDPAAALELCEGLAEFWDVRGFVGEGRRWLARALAAARDLPPSPARVEVLCQAAHLASRQGDMESVRPLLASGLAMAEELGYSAGLARISQGLAMARRFFEGDKAGDVDYQAEALRLWRELGDPLGIGQALGPLAGQALADRDYPEAERLYRESLSLFRRVGDVREVAGALWNLAEVALAQGEDLRAADLARQALEQYRELEDRHGIATALEAICRADPAAPDAFRPGGLHEESVGLFRELDDRGCLAQALAAGGRQILELGDAARARPMVEEALDLAGRIGERAVVASALDGLGELSRAGGDWEGAARWAGAAAACARSAGISRSEREQATHDRLVAEARQRLGEDSFARAWSEGADSWRPGGGPPPRDRAVLTQELVRRVIEQLRR